MKKKMIAGLAVALTCGLGLAACGGTEKAALGAVDAQKYDLKSLTEIQLDGTLLNHQVSKNGYVISKKPVGADVHFGVTKVSTGAVVVPYAKVNQIKIIEAGAKDYFAVEKTNETTAVTTYDIYDEAGVKVFSDVENYNASNFWALKDGKNCYEIMSVNDYSVCYKQKGENARTLYWSTQVGKGGYDWKSDVSSLAVQTKNVKDIKYGIRIQPISATSTSYKLRYVLYDLSKSKEIRSYTLDSSIPSMMNPINGNIIFQEHVMVDNYAKNYDYVSSGEKYKLNTYALNIITGKTKKLSNKYVFEVARDNSIVASEIEENEAINGVVVKAAVINKDKTITKTTNVLVDKNLKISELDYNYFNVVDKPVQKVAKNRYYATSNVGDSSSAEYVYNIVDGNYQVKVNLRNEPVAIAENGLVVDNDDSKYAIIDFDGKLVTDYTYDDFVSVNGNYAMLAKEVTITENGSTITETRYYSVNTKTGAETLFATEKSGEYTLTDGTKVNGITNHTVGGKYSLIHTEKASTTAGNLVYTFYSASGAKLGEFDVKVGNVTVVTYGENNSKVLVMVGDVVLLAA